VAVSPHEHHRSAGEVIGQPRRRLAGGGSVVSGQHSQMLYAKDVDGSGQAST
jgi:hypothetical protein